MSDDPANLLRTERINFSMRPQHVRMTRDHTVVWCLLSREHERISVQTLYCQKLESLLKICAADSVLSLLVFTKLFFESRTVRARETWRENRIWREITNQGHSRLCILGSLKSWWRIAYRHVITLASCLKFPKNSQQKRQKLPFSTTPLSFDAASPGNLRECPYRWNWKYLENCTS